MNFRKAFLAVFISGFLFSTTVTQVLANTTTGSFLSIDCILTPGETKDTAIVLTNTDNSSHTFTFSSDNGGNIYDVSFTNEGSIIHSILVDGKSSVSVNIALTLKGTPIVMTDKLTVNAIREDGVISSIPLTIIIKEDYILNGSSLFKKINLLSGKNVELSFSVKNDGSKPLTNIQLQTELPYKWVATNISPTPIVLKPGESSILKMNVFVPSSQTSGNINIAVNIVSAETKSNRIIIPVTIRTSFELAYLMGGGVLLIAGFTLYQFKKHGRR